MSRKDRRKRPRQHHFLDRNGPDQRILRRARIKAGKKKNSVSFRSTSAGMFSAVHCIYVYVRVCARMCARVYANVRGTQPRPHKIGFAAIWRFNDP